MVGGIQVKFVVVNILTTGLSADKHEIIEVGAVRWEDGTCTATFQSLIKPSAPVPLEIKEWTGITSEMLQDAPEADEIFGKFLAFISGFLIAGPNINLDLQFIEAACKKLGYDSPVSKDTLDLLIIARILQPLAADFRLIDIANRLQVPLRPSHRALDGAQITADVFSAFITQAAAILPFQTLSQLESLAGVFSPLTAEFFSTCADARLGQSGTSMPEANEYIQSLVFTSAKPVSDADSQTSTKTELSLDDEGEEEAQSLFSDELSGQDMITTSTNLLTNGSPIEKILPGFEVRPGQQQMVNAVAEALQGDTHLLVEAGTGTGKSLAYLIPAALYAKANDTRVVVSTHTIALQDQILERDFVTLKKLVDAPLTLAIFKGRTHYVCMRKVSQETRGVDFGTPTDDVIAYMMLLSWLVQTPAGCREELALQGAMSQVWPRIQSESETCIGKHCAFFRPCYYFRARSKAYDADVVVTNHSLVFSDMKADNRVLPRYDKLIIDEAHHLEEVATKHLGGEVHLYQCLGLIGRLARDGGKHGVLPELLARLSLADADSVRVVPVLSALSEDVLRLRLLVEGAFVALASFIPTGQGEYRLTHAIETTQYWIDYVKLANEMLGILQHIQEIREDVRTAAESERENDIAGRLFDAYGFFEELLGHVNTLCNAGDLNDAWVVWIEQNGMRDRRQLSLHRAPIDVADILSDKLFASKSSVVLTSATLSVEGNFAFTKRRLGLEDAEASGRLQSLSVASPFNYEKQVLLCIPSDAPELAKMDASEAAVWLSDALYQLARASNGRLMALFTSHALLRATAAVLRDPLTNAGFQLLAQGIDGTRSRLLESFRANSNSVLLGAQSFWEGIDLPGNQLTTLVIVRLPFAPPTHPVTEARHQKLEAEGKSAFWQASLPDAVVRFRQGFGRLIRTVQDRGVVVVYDKRLITSKYGKTFIKSLPGVLPIVEPEQVMIKRIKEFLAMHKLH